MVGKNPVATAAAKAGQKRSLRERHSDLHDHHKRAITTILLAAALDITLGCVFGFVQGIGVPGGLYFATTTATTAGGDNVTPVTLEARLVTVLIMITVIPLFAAAFSLITSGLTSHHVTKAEERIKDHVVSAVNGYGNYASPGRHVRTAGSCDEEEHF